MKKPKKQSLSIFDFEEPNATTTTISQNDIDGGESIEQTPPTRHVVSIFPSIKSLPYKIAIVGDFAGEADVFHGIPFSAQGTPDSPYSGAAGRRLNQDLSRNGIVREACFLGFLHSGLGDELTTYSPNIVLLMGKACLLAAHNQTSVDSWRGSIFMSTTPGPFFGLKCITTFAIRDCLRNYSWMPLLYFDIKKTKLHATTSNFIPPTRDLIINNSVADTVNLLERIRSAHTPIALDIEGYVDAMSCLSISDSPGRAFIIPLATRGNLNYYDSIEDELLIWRALANVLEDPTIPKILQNSLYDRFVLQYSYGLVVRGVVDDTMLRAWEFKCEFEKSLGFLCSIYTDEPYYKSERKSEDVDQFHKYCCRDSAVTLEINQQLTRFLDKGQDSHYRFNMILLGPLLYMENRGIRYDIPAARECLRVVNQHLAVLQQEIDQLTGKGFPEGTTIPTILAQARSIMCYKRDQTRVKKDYEEAYAEIIRICGICVAEGRYLNVDEMFYVAIECEFSRNIKSTSFRDYIYDDLKLPKQYVKKVDSKTGEKKMVLSANYVSLLKIQKVKPTRIVELALQIGVLRTRAQMLAIHADVDGRIRAGYNLVGTETGRLTCYTSPTGSGYNLQTIPSKDETKPEGHPLKAGMRHLFMADEGYSMFQCDLSGADGWTVAANCANLGDRTMLDDYLFGIKPAKVLCYMLRHGADSLRGKSRSDIKELTKEVSSKDWDYFASKVGQHGSSYLLGPDSLSNLVFMLSDGTISLTRQESKDLQNLFFIRYKVKLWHLATERLLKTNPAITTSFGYRRQFFGRSTEILGQALAHEPQAVTTYVTNLAMYNLWTDRDNRVEIDGRIKLRAEPLHQVHDALVGQFKKKDTTWFISKIKHWFNNKIIVAGQTLIIPFEMGIGPSWGEMEEVKL